MWEIKNLSEPFASAQRVLVLNRLKLFTEGVEAPYAFLNERIKLVLEKLPDIVFWLALQDIHSIAEGRLKDWKEEEHEAEKLLFKTLERKE